ncbi:hypothetical protein [Vitiosangium sp. GDMCC 1.1324]|uniref:hypothetical protein n=1 Tax=Vitiosangium sp. (strain GDMCC 1.1324) TaxID=2138576 RepID=UPI000D3A69FC|nr:hypothetical protein [Vitiosangium sp. GDMCC 1.1324]PTL77818.1 hypothetical protein DAT35_42200 [Vitiosangium sp. GDMCC 1.1324]
MVTAALLILLLSQTGDPEAPREPQPAPIPGPVTLAPPESPLPVMRYGEPSVCGPLGAPNQELLGRYRVQCDEKTRRCLVAPEYELDVDGTPSDRPLERVPYCRENPEELGQRVAEGYTFVPAIAEAPRGWYRDERGRVMQFNFDLHRRVWLGGAWAPLWREGEERNLSRGRVDFGIITEFPRDVRLMRRLTVLDTELVLGQDASLDTTLLRYDTNVRPNKPPVRVTTFLGEPRRHDFGLDMGLWLEVLRLELIRRSGSEAVFYSFVALHPTLDLWHSADLSSYVRVRAGPSLEYDRTNHFLTLVPGAAFEGNLTLDTNGFHHLTFGVEAEKVFFGEAVDGRPETPERLRVRAGYELILLAFNDQPLSLVLDGRGQWRSDLVDVPSVWEWSVHTGLRFSLWAPPRRSAPLATAR